MNVIQDYPTYSRKHRYPHHGDDCNGDAIKTDEKMILNGAGMMQKYGSDDSISANNGQNTSYETNSTFNYAIHHVSSLSSMNTITARSCANHHQTNSSPSLQLIKLSDVERLITTPLRTLSSQSQIKHISTSSMLFQSPSKCDSDSGGVMMKKMGIKDLAVHMKSKPFFFKDREFNKIDLDSNNNTNNNKQPYISKCYVQEEPIRQLKTPSSSISTPRSFKINANETILETSPNHYGLRSSQITPTSTRGLDSEVPPPPTINEMMTPLISNKMQLTQTPLISNKGGHQRHHHSNHSTTCHKGSPFHDSLSSITSTAVNTVGEVVEEHVMPILTSDIQSSMSSNVAKRPSDVNQSKAAKASNTGNVQGQRKPLTTFHKCVCNWPNCSTYQTLFQEVKHPIFDGVVKIRLIKDQKESMRYMECLNKTLGVDPDKDIEWKQRTRKLDCNDGVSSYFTCTYIVAKHHFTERHIVRYHENPKLYSFSRPFSRHGATKYLHTVNPEYTYTYDAFNNRQHNTTTTASKDSTTLYLQCPNVPIDVVDSIYKQAIGELKERNIMQQQNSERGTQQEALDELPELDSEPYRRDTFDPRFEAPILSAASSICSTSNTSDIMDGESNTIQFNEKEEKEENKNRVMEEFHNAILKMKEDENESLKLQLNIMKLQLNYLHEMVYTLQEQRILNSSVSSYGDQMSLMSSRSSGSAKHLTTRDRNVNKLNEKNKYPHQEQQQTQQERKSNDKKEYYTNIQIGVHRTTSPPLQEAKHHNQQRPKWSNQNTSIPGEINCSPDAGGKKRLSNESATGLHEDYFSGSKSELNGSNINEASFSALCLSNKVWPDTFTVSEEDEDKNEEDELSEIFDDVSDLKSVMTAKSFVSKYKHLILSRNISVGDGQEQRDRVEDRIAIHDQHTSDNIGDEDDDDDGYDDDGMTSLASNSVSAMKSLSRSLSNDDDFVSQMDVGDRSITTSHGRSESVLSAADLTEASSDQDTLGVSTINTNSGHDCLYRKRTVNDSSNTTTTNSNNCNRMNNSNNSNPTILANNIAAHTLDKSNRLVHSTHIRGTYQVTNIVLTDPYGEKGSYTGSMNIHTNLPHGFGRLQYERDHKWYEGDWCDGRWTGQGRLANAEGDIYDGSLLNDKKHGYGVMRFRDGRTFAGDYFHGNMVKGKMTYNDGSTYDGSWFGGTRHGSGICIFADGSMYEGDFYEGEFHGQGKMTWSDGGYYVGAWREGDMYGFGREVRPDGTLRHDGKWIGGRPVR